MEILSIKPLNETQLAAKNDALRLAEKLADHKAPISWESLQELYDALLNDHPEYSDGVTVLGVAFGEKIGELTE